MQKSRTKMRHFCVHGSSAFCTDFFTLPENALRGALLHSKSRRESTPVPLPKDFCTVRRHS